MILNIRSLRRQIKAQRYKDIPVTLSLLFIPMALSLLITEEINTACILLSAFIAVYAAGALAIKKRRPLFFRPLLIAAAILFVIVLEKII
ncbi:MAG: hypothetical protein H6Q26_1230 [Bacteroidetes bacterium]|uniref:hypothetical protein n=1 Tax=unclassified Chitinophaga TaxID=2619133 RepID=UPI0009C7FFEA|nr:MULTISPECIES: hypothetical protein [unclassified Chitinophaga]MBP1651073.1 hypothetical protein [Bacteroidota bacterium]OMP74758.1 hypothetical protein BW716_33685 [[Flexibacter] sp. ATCC 35208]WPV64351.1 hypothetical protein QQL36_21350 [Chitinophaga sp. LS1]